MVRKGGKYWNRISADRVRACPESHVKVRILEPAVSVLMFYSPTLLPPGAVANTLSWQRGHCLICRSLSFLCTSTQTQPWVYDPESTTTPPGSHDYGLRLNHVTKTYETMLFPFLKFRSALPWHLEQHPPSLLYLTEPCTDVVSIPLSVISSVTVSHTHVDQPHWPPFSSLNTRKPLFPSLLWLLLPSGSPFPYQLSPSGLSSNVTSLARTSLTSLSKEVTALALCHIAVFKFFTFFSPFWVPFLTHLLTCLFALFPTEIYTLWGQGPVRLSVVFSSAWKNA